MVSTRSGRTVAEPPASAPAKPRRTTAAAAAAASAADIEPTPAPRRAPRSTKAAAAPAPAAEPEPVTPATAGLLRRSKRGRASAPPAGAPPAAAATPATPTTFVTPRGAPVQVLAGDASPASVDTAGDAKKAAVAGAAALALPDTPSPGSKPRASKKRKGAAAGAGGGDAATYGGALACLAAVLVVAAAVAAGAALWWPAHGAAVTAAWGRALEAGRGRVEPAVELLSSRLLRPSSSPLQHLLLQGASWRPLDGAAALLRARAAAAAEAAAPALRALDAQTASARGALRALLLQVHVRYPALQMAGQLLPRGLGGLGGEPAAWSPDAIAGVLPGGRQWEELAADISERLRAAPAARGHKAPALLLACGSADDCAEAAAALAALPPRGDACALGVDGALLAAEPQPAAALQARLAPFLRRCPAGVVVVARAEALPVAAVPALHAALSEMGGFEHDGRVDGTRAAYALLMQVPASRAAAAAAAPDTIVADAAVKGAFFARQQAQAALLQAAAAGEEDGAAAESAAAIGRALATLHRRIDFAAPVRLGDAAAAAAAEEEEGEQAQEL